MFGASVWKWRCRRLGAWAAVGVMLAGSALGAEARKFAGHSDATTGVAFLADGRRAASCGDGGDGTVRIWDLATGRELRRFSAGGVGLSALAVSPDSKAVLAAGRDHVIRLWMVDGPPDAKPKRLEGHGDVVNHLAFSPDGKVAASTSWDGTARLWDFASGKEMQKFEGHQGSVNGVSFSPDGRRLATGGADHTVRLWDAATGKETRKFEGHAGWVGDVAFAPDGRRVASAGGQDEPVVILWDPSTGAVVRRIDAPPDAGWGVAFAGGGRLLVIESDTVAVFDVATGRETNRFTGHAGQVYAVAASADGRRFLSAAADKTVRLWDLSNRELAALPAPPHSTAAPAEPNAPAARNDPFAKAAEIRAKLDADRDGDVELQDAFMEALRAAAPALTEVPVGSEKQPSTFTRLALNSRRLGFDGLRFKAPADGGRRDMKWEFIMPAVKNERGRAMKSWYIAPLTGDMIGFTGYVLGKDRPIEGVDLSKKYHVVQKLENAQIRPGVEYLVWFSFEPNAPAVPTYVKINLVAPSSEVQAQIDATESAMKRSINLPDSAYALGASPDGHRVLMAAGSTLYNGDVETGQVQKRWDWPAGNVRTAAFSLDGKLATVGCNDGKVILVDVDAGKKLRVSEGHSGGIHCLAFLPNGQQFVSGSEDRTARLWDVATGKQLRTFEGHTDQVLCLAVSPDGRRFATGPSIEDKVARVWDLTTGKLVARLEGNEAAVYALAFSPDGKRVLTGGEDTSLRLYDAASGRPIRRFKPDNGSRVHSLLFLPNGHQVVAGSEGTLLTFWSTSTGRYLHGYEGPYSGTQVLAPAPGGRFLSGCGDHSVRLWTLPPAATDLAKARPTRADLAYLRQVVDDLATTTLDEIGDFERIDLNDKADDAGLSHLTQLKNLEMLSITRAPNFGGAGLKHLKGLTRLRSLDLSQTNVGDAGLAFIAVLPRLETLRLTGTKVTNAGIPQLKSLKNLKQLHLQDTAVDDAALKTLVALPNLELLNLAGTNVDGSGLALVREFKKLRILYLNDTKVSEAALEGLRKARPMLEAWN